MKFYMKDWEGCQVREATAVEVVQFLEDRVGLQEERAECANSAARALRQENRKLQATITAHINDFRTLSQELSDSEKLCQGLRDELGEVRQKYNEHRLRYEGCPTAEQLKNVVGTHYQQALYRFHNKELQTARDDRDSWMQRAQRAEASLRCVLDPQPTDPVTEPPSTWAGGLREQMKYGRGFAMPDPDEE